MIVCICRNVPERKIHQAVVAGATTMLQLRESLVVGTCCGKCHSCAKRVLRDCLDNAEQSRPMLFPSGALAI